MSATAARDIKEEAAIGHHYGWPNPHAYSDTCITGIEAHWTGIQKRDAPVTLDLLSLPHSRIPLPLHAPSDGRCPALILSAGTALNAAAASGHLEATSVLMGHIRGTMQQQRELARLEDAAVVR